MIENEDEFLGISELQSQHAPPKSQSHVVKCLCHDLNFSSAALSLEYLSTQTRLKVSKKSVKCPR